MTDKIGAKQFREPLMKILGELSGMKPDTAIDHRMVYEPLLKSMGITADEHGCQGDTGTPWVERWTQWAFKDLTVTNPPLTVSLGKGKWALTTAGVQRVRDMSSEVSVKAVVENHPYHSDPYIRSLAAKATPCFDNFSKQSPTCSSCPLRVECQGAQEKAFVEMAQTLANGGVVTSKVIPLSKPKPRIVPAVGTISGGVLIKNTKNQPCRMCGKLIAVDTNCIFVRKSAGWSGMYHVACFEELVRDGKADPLIVR